MASTTATSLWKMFSISPSETRIASETVKRALAGRSSVAWKVRGLEDRTPSGSSTGSGVNCSRQRKDWPGRTSTTSWALEVAFGMSAGTPSLRSVSACWRPCGAIDAGISHRPPRTRQMRQRTV